MLKHEAHIIARMSLIDEMTPAVGNMNKKLKGTAKQASAVKQQMRFMRGGMGQVGHQVQDIAVQLQMGQNAMLVFGQQGSQIASLFGPHGAIIGAFLAVGAAVATSLMPSFFGASKATKDLKDSTESLVDKYDDLDESLKRVARTVVQGKIDALSDSIKAANEEIAHQSKIFKSAELGGVVYASTVKKAGQEIDDQRNIIILANAEIDKLTKKVDGSSDAFEKQEKALNKEAATLGMSASALALYEISLMNITPEQKVYLANLRLSNISRQEEIDLAKENAKALEKETEARAKSALEFVKFNIESSRYIDKLRAKDKERKEKEIERQKEADEARMAQLRRSLKSERRLLAEDYDSNRALIEKEVKDEAEKYSLLLQLREKYHDDLKKLTEADKKISDELKEFRDTYRPIFNEFGDGFVDAITGAEKFSDAIRDMARNVIDSLLRIAVQKLIVDSLFSKFEGAFFSSSSGTGGGSGVSSGGSASRTGTLGGPVQSGRSVLVGERGPEIFTPSSEGQITPNNEISGGGGVTIVQHINVTTGVQQTVRAEIRQLMPQIAQAAKGAVADARLRGGSFSKAMGTT